MLLTRIEHFPEFSDDKVEALRQAVEQITPDYAAILERHRKVQSEMLNRVTVDFGGASQYGMSDRGVAGRSAVEAGLFARLAGEDFRNGPPLVHPHQRQVSRASPAEASFTINLQTPGMEPATSAAAKKPDPPALACCKQPARCRATSAKAWKPTSIGSRAWPRTAGPTRKNIFGFRGTSYPLWPQQRNGRQILLLQQLRDWEHLALLDFRRRPGLPPVLGPLPGHRRSGFPPQSRRAGPERAGAVLRRFPHGHGQERELHFRPILLAGEHAHQHRPVGAQC